METSLDTSPMLRQHSANRRQYRARETDYCMYSLGNRRMSRRWTQSI